MPPYSEIRISEVSKTLSGRLAGLLFADQGAEVGPARQLWLEQRLIPLDAPYRTSDNRFAMGIAGTVEWEKELCETGSIQQVCHLSLGGLTTDRNSSCRF